VKGEVGGDAVGAEGMGVFFFIQLLDSAHTDGVVIEVEFPGLIDGMADLDFLSYIGGGYFIEGAFKADGGIIVNHAFMADEEDLVQFGLG
jgi:hypothetical protein